MQLCPKNIIKYTKNKSNLQEQMQITFKEAIEGYKLL